MRDCPRGRRTPWEGHQVGPGSQRKVTSINICLVSPTVQQVMRRGPQAAGPAVRGPQPPGGPRDVLREPHPSSRGGELQQPRLRGGLDHWGVDRGEGPRESRNRSGFLTLVVSRW